MFGQEADFWGNDWILKYLWEDIDLSNYFQSQIAVLKLNITTPYSFQEAENFLCQAPSSDPLEKKVDVLGKLVNTLV